MVDFIANIYDMSRRRTNAAAVLADAQAARFVIQDFRPLAESIEWELGLSYYERGSQAFAGDRPIPFAINNDGNVSVDAAEVLFKSLEASEEEGALDPEIRVLELGPGLGLFARYVLDAFRELCRERNKDYYERLTYVAGDRSEQMLSDICRRGVFANRCQRRAGVGPSRAGVEPVFGRIVEYSGRRAFPAGASG